MPFNGAGQFNRVYNWTADANNSIPIMSARMDAEDNGFATGLSNCICKDGQTTITADIPLNNHKLTGLATATASQDALNLATGDGRYTPIITNGGFKSTLIASSLTANRTISVPDADINLTGANAVYFAVKSADTTRTSTTTLANDPDLTFTGVPAGSYAVELFMMPSQLSAGAIGLKWALSSGGFATNDYGMVVNQSINNTITTRANLLAMSTGLAYAQVFTSVNDYILIKGILILSSAATVALQWAQNTSSVNYSALLNGSYLRLTKK
jgi:hypothetical protein